MEKQEVIKHLNQSYNLSAEKRKIAGQAQWLKWAEELAEALEASYDVDATVATLALDKNKIAWRLVAYYYAWGDEKELRRLLDNDRNDADGEPVCHQHIVTARAMLLLNRPFPAHIILQELDEFTSAAFDLELRSKRAEETIIKYLAKEVKRL